MGKAKTAERELARLYYVQRGLDLKTIADKVDVRYNTVLKWCQDDLWETLREAHLSMPDQLVNDLKELIGQLTRQRLELGALPDSEEVARKKAAVSDEISKISKALEAAKKEGQLSLGTRVQVISELTDDMLRDNPELFNKLGPYLENWLTEKAKL